MVTSQHHVRRHGTEKEEKEKEEESKRERETHTHTEEERREEIKERVAGKENEIGEEEAWQ